MKCCGLDRIQDTNWGWVDAGRSSTREMGVEEYLIRVQFVHTISHPRRGILCKFNVIINERYPSTVSLSVY